jgi:hypothetical protein
MHATHTSIELGAHVVVYRNDAITVDQALGLDITHVVISPGPGHPSTDAGVSKHIIRAFEGKLPVFGVDEFSTLQAAYIAFWPLSTRQITLIYDMHRF